MNTCIRTILMLGSVLLTGCQTMSGGYLPVAELEEFTPQVNEQRIRGTMKIRWEVRPDAREYCASTLGMGGSGQLAPLACAIWNVASKECTVITGARTTHLALGHEVRHCFEGHFH